MAEVSCTTPAERETRGGLKAARRTRQLFSSAANGTELCCSGVRALPDLCWCSISEPVFPPQARVVLTNSGKYAHYGPGLSGRSVRFGRLADCINAALSGRAPWATPLWLI